MPSREEIELLLIDEEIARRRAIADFSYFVKLAWHIIEPTVPYQDGWHVGVIGDHLEGILDGRIRNLIINIPPRMSKSTLIAIMFPAWVWLRFPGKKFVFASYASTLSVRDSIKCRALIESDWYRSFFKTDEKWKLKHDQNKQDEFTNTLMGWRIAIGVEGGATGKGGDIIVVDDPLSAMQAYSKAARDYANNWWDTEMPTRTINPKTTARIIVMQRLHPEDLSGHVMDQGGYDELILPMEFEWTKHKDGTVGPRNPTKLGWIDPRTTPGELLAPDRYGEAELTELKKRLGSNGYAGQMQQRPAAAEGAIIKRSWLKYYRALPSDIAIRAEWVQSWDLAFKGKDTSDYVVGQLWVKHPNGVDKYLVDQVRARMTFTETIKAIEAFSAKHPKAKLKLIEDKANGPAVIDSLKKKLEGIVAVQVSDSKVGRVNSVAVSFEAGNVHIPDPSIAPWISDYVEELCSFPGVGNDDQVDATTQALMRWNMKTAGDFTDDLVPKSNKTVSSRGGNQW